MDTCAERHENICNNSTDAFLKIAKDIGRENFRTYFQSKYRRLEYVLNRSERTPTEFDRYDCKFCRAKRKSDSIFVDSGKNTLSLDFALNKRETGYPSKS